MKTYTHIIWDFNGTILDDLFTCFTCANRLLEKHGHKPLATVEDYKKVFGFPISDYYRRLGFDFSKTPYEELAPEWVSYYNELDPFDTLYPGIPELLNQIKEMGLTQIILSATHREMLLRQVEHLGILPYFDEVLGLGNIHAKSKLELALQWREKHPQASILFLGDTNHDAEVAKEIDADCILFATGHQPKKVLETCRCLEIFDSPSHFLSKISLFLPSSYL